ncbi:hypothetical protein D3C86_274820 [compost metagenome]
MACASARLPKQEDAEPHAPFSFSPPGRHPGADARRARRSVRRARPPRDRRRPRGARADARRAAGGRGAFAHRLAAVDPCAARGLRPVQRPRARGRGAHGLLVPGRLGDRARLAARRPLPLSVRARRDRRVAAGRGHAPAALGAPGRAPARDRRREGRGLCRLGAECAARVGGRRLQQLGRPAPHDAAAPRVRRVGDLRAARGDRRQLRVRDPFSARRGAAQGRPLRVLVAAAPRHRLRRGAAARARADARRARRGQRAPGADQHLRSAPGLVAPQAPRPGMAGLPRAGRHARALCARHGLHAHRAAAHHRAPLRRLVGLPAHRPVCADLALRHARRLPPFRRSRACRGAGRDPRLGARALSDRRARPGQLRRHRAVRVRRSARGFPQRLADADLQLRPHGGAQLPRRQCAVLAGALRRGRPARGRGGVDAVPRLQPQGRRVGAECAGRAREPGGHRFPAPHEPRGGRGASGGCDHRGRVDELSRCDAAAGRRRAGVSLQVEHGVDERHAGVCGDRSGLPQAPSPADHLRADVRAQRELRVAAVA